MTVLERSGKIFVNRSPEELYDLISDVTRMGEWSPVCKACWWDEGAGPSVGAWFTGRNEVPGRTWEARSVVVAASRGHEFAFKVGGNLVKWSYSFRAVEAGTELTESWEFLPDGIAGFHVRFPEHAEAERQISNQSSLAETGIPATLAAIKRAAEY